MPGTYFDATNSVSLPWMSLMPIWLYAELLSLGRTHDSVRNVRAMSAVDIRIIAMAGSRMGHWVKRRFLQITTRQKKNNMTCNPSEWVMISSRRQKPSFQHIKQTNRREVLPPIGRWRDGRLKKTSICAPRIVIRLNLVHTIPTVANKAAAVNCWSMISPHSPVKGGILGMSVRSSNKRVRYDVGKGRNSGRRREGECDWTIYNLYTQTDVCPDGGLILTSKPDDSS